MNIHIIRAISSALIDGVKHHQIEGIQMPICSVGKTVADCFKHRNKVGIDVAIKALRDCLRQRKSPLRISGNTRGFAEYRA